MKKVLKFILNLLKFIKDVIIWIVLLIFITLGIIYIIHYISNNSIKKEINMPGNLIEVYDHEYIHAVSLGSGDYTILMYPGMGTPSPYYDYFNLANELSVSNRVIIVEPLGYGFSSMTTEDRNLKNYTIEMQKVIDYYELDNNIILLGHSYSGPIIMNYANEHTDTVKGIVCLDCTSSYQIATHVTNGQFKEEVPHYSNYLSWLATSGLLRAYGNTFGKQQLYDTYLVDIPKNMQKEYQYFIYNKTLNKTFIKEANEFPYIELEMLGKQYHNNLHVVTFLANDTIDNMKKYKEDGDFLYDWMEMHQLQISNSSIQKIYTLDGNHYIHHNHVPEITSEVNHMINEIKNSINLSN